MNSEHGPAKGSNHESCADLLRTYNNHIYRKSVNFKGPLLWATSHFNNDISPTNMIPYDVDRINIKRVLREKQGSSDPEEWTAFNFVINSCTGLRVNAPRFVVTN